MEELRMRLSRLRERLRKIQVPIDPNRGKDLEKALDAEIEEYGEEAFEKRIGIWEAQVEIAETF